MIHASIVDLSPACMKNVLEMAGEYSSNVFGFDFILFVSETLQLSNGTHPSGLSSDCENIVSVGSLKWLSVF